VRNVALVRPDAATEKPTPTASQGASANHVGPEGAGFPAARVFKILAHPKTLAHRATARVMDRHRTMAKCRITARPRTTVRYRLISHKTMVHRISRSRRQITAHNRCQIMDHRMTYNHITRYQFPSQLYPATSQHGDGTERWTRDGLYAHYDAVWKMWACPAFTPKYMSGCE